MKNIEDLIPVNENMYLDKLEKNGASSSVISLFNSSYHSMRDPVSWSDLADILSRVYMDLKK